MKTILTFGAVVLLTFAFRSAAGEPASKPNVLIVLVDDAGYGDYSCHGNPVMKTPNVDKLHKETVRLVKIAQDGDYEITLRRWPEEAKAFIRGSVAEWESKDRVGKHKLPDGKALLITKARFTVGEFSGEKPVGETDTATRFELMLKKGEAMLKGAF